MVPLAVTAGLIAAGVSQASTDYGPAVWQYPACNYTVSGNGHSFVVIHDMEGYYEASISYLNRCDTDTNGNFNVSASIYYLVNGLKNGVDEDGHRRSIGRRGPRRRLQPR